MFGHCLSGVWEKIFRETSCSTYGCNTLLMVFELLLLELFDVMTTVVVVEVDAVGLWHMQTSNYDKRLVS